MASDDEIARRFEAGRIESALERTRSAVERQTRVIESLNRPVDEGPRLPGVVVLLGVVGLVLVLPPDSVWHPFGRALRRTAAALEWAGDVAIWLGLLWLVTWPLWRRRRATVPAARPSR